MEKIVAIGPREQDFFYTNGFFNESITLYGSNLNGNISYAAARKYRINHNVFSQDQSDFIDQNMLNKINENPNVKFMSYDPNLVFACDEEIIKRTICLNEKRLMDVLNNKITFRRWAEPLCLIHRADILSGSECTYKILQQHFIDYKRFIVQKSVSSGGEGTFIMSLENHEEIEQQFEKDELLLVSGYEEKNIPLNIHAIIYEDDIILFPPSIQIIQAQGNRLLYRGADFEAIKQIEERLLVEFKDNVKSICLQLQREGYRGVAGIDAMIVDERVYIMEMNNRFQGSTLLLNLALKDQKMPSMQEMNYESFYKKKAMNHPEHLNVPYSMFIYLADEKGQIQPTHKRNFDREETFVESYNDGLEEDWNIAPYATLERVVFRTNIISITYDGSTAIHPNIYDFDQTWYDEIVFKNNKLYLKIALINQGVYFSEEARSYLIHNGGIREAVYNAVDIYLDNFVINSAIGVKFCALSPFSIQLINNELVLYCCDAAIQKVSIQRADKIRELHTSNGASVKDICLLATDRVRIQHSKNCHFKRCGIGCNFCEVDNHEFSFELEDIFESIDYYIDSDYEFRHFLIGGRSNETQYEAEDIIAIANHICSRGKWPIYVMCIPPLDTTVLDRFYNAHITEVAFNIEIWDRDLAKKWMPGKGSISRDRYLKMLEYATRLWGKDGNVRTSFIVGLEPEESLFAGIDAVCSIGVAPILSVFRPIPGTKGEMTMPLLNEKLLMIYNESRKICDRHGLSLGPQCTLCQNNTLSMPTTLS